MAIWYDLSIMIKLWFLGRRGEERGEDEQRNTIAMSYTSFLEIKSFLLSFSSAFTEMLFDFTRGLPPVDKHDCILLLLFFRLDCMWVVSFDVRFDGGSVDSCRLVVLSISDMCMY
jgi:hypothetical protein